MTYIDVDPIVYPLLFGQQVIKVPGWKPNSVICGPASTIQYKAFLQDSDILPSFITFDNITLKLTVNSNNLLDVGNYSIIIFGKIQDVSAIQQIDVEVYLPCERNEILPPTISNFDYKIGSGLKSISIGSWYSSITQCGTIKFTASYKGTLLPIYDMIKFNNEKHCESCQSFNNLYYQNLWNQQTRYIRANYQQPLRQSYNKQLNKY
eukprot:403344868